MGRRRKKKLHKVEPMNWHHRKAKTHGGSGDILSPNMIHVPVNKHRAFHLLFHTQTPTEIARTLTETWISPDWELIVVARRKE